MAAPSVAYGPIGKTHTTVIYIVQKQLMVHLVGLIPWECRVLRESLLLTEQLDMTSIASGGSRRPKNWTVGVQETGH